MIKKIKSFMKGSVYSLRARMLVVIIAGVILATLAYILTRFVMRTTVDAYYATDEARRKREAEYIVDLQTFVDENAISSSDTSKIAEWVYQKRYAYVMLYVDDQLLYSGGMGDAPAGGLPQVPGVSLDYPTQEEIKDYANKNDLHTISMGGVTILASVSDFSEYFYYSMTNMVSLITAFVVLSIVMMSYFFGITRRIATLTKDVTIVSEVNMNHSIQAEGNDELAKLSQNIEQMRSSMLENIEKEKEALDANAELITSMSHDIRTPLTVLLGYLDLMKTRQSDDVMQEYIRASESTALRLKELSDDMFRYFLVFGNRDMDADIQEYDGRTLIEQLLSEHIFLLSENGYEAYSEGDGELTEGLKIRTDAPKAMRVIDNVFSNIFKYADISEPIGFALDFSTEDKERVFITVTNKIKQGADKAESTGIGLKTCKKIAEAIDMSLNYGAEGGYFSVKLGFEVVREIRIC